MGWARDNRLAGLLSQLPPRYVVGLLSHTRAKNTFEIQFIIFYGEIFALLLPPYQWACSEISTTTSHGHTEQKTLLTFRTFGTYLTSKHWLVCCHRCCHDMLWAWPEIRIWANAHQTPQYFVSCILNFVSCTWYFLFCIWYFTDFWLYLQVSVSLHNKHKFPQEMF